MSSMRADCDLLCHLNFGKWCKYSLCLLKSAWWRRPIMRCVKSLICIAHGPCQRKLCVPDIHCIFVLEHIGVCFNEIVWCRVANGLRWNWRSSMSNDEFQICSRWCKEKLLSWLSMEYHEYFHLGEITPWYIQFVGGGGGGGAYYVTTQLSIYPLVSKIQDPITFCPWFWHRLTYITRHFGNPQWHCDVMSVVPDTSLCS